MMSGHQSALRSITEKMTVPNLSILKSLMGSNERVASLLRKSACFLSSNLDKTLMPNVEFFQSLGIPMENIRRFLYVLPRYFLIKLQILWKSVDKAIEFGVPRTSVVFIQAASVFVYTSKEMWEVELTILRDFGFSDDDIFSMFRKQPMVFSQSREKMESVLELLVGTGKYSISDIVSNPSSMGCSIKKRLEPWLQILALLESRSLIEKWPGLRVLFASTDDKFFDSFVRPYYDEIGEEYTECFEGKRE